MTIPEAMFMRKKHASVVQSLPTYPAGAFAGRGIVVLAGGKYSEIAATTLGMIRLLGSRLPVEVWMVDRIEEKEAWCEELSPQGIVCRFISDYSPDMSAFTRHYQLKILAIMFSSFVEVLYLDADSMPVVNPDPVFDAPAYVDTGALLWPDYWRATESPFTPYIIGRSVRKSTTIPHFKTVEAGQMLWNKEKHWKVSSKTYRGLLVTSLADMTSPSACRPTTTITGQPISTPSLHKGVLDGVIRIRSQRLYEL
ncbi:MAG: hypothetical protein LQ343_002612 [Gyalolechia ehrenbergii]|nr:MAG: hypothetical protein LQ343_002612 [Gyalolechia ehrenbergii]